MAEQTSQQAEFKADQVDAFGFSYVSIKPPRLSGKSYKANPISLVQEQYNFTYPKRGTAVIINNRNFDQEKTGQSDRDGTDVDASALESVFIQMGFDVIRHDNLNRMDMMLTFRRLAAADHSNEDCFVCAILSHGEEGVLYATDGVVYIEKITRLFKPDECPTLAEKPKIFLFQACRGRFYDYGHNVDDDQTDAALDPVSVRKIPVEADILMAYSVCPGFYSWRNNVDGSWFVQAITEVFKEHSDSMDIMDMMTMVNRKVAYDFSSCTDREFTSDMKQMPCIVSTLTRKVYFHPKEESS